LKELEIIFLISILLLFFKSIKEFGIRAFIKNFVKGNNLKFIYKINIQLFTLQLKNQLIAPK